MLIPSDKIGLQLNQYIPVKILPTPLRLIRRRVVGIQNLLAPSVEVVTKVSAQPTKMVVLGVEWMKIK